MSRPDYIENQLEDKYWKYYDEFHTELVLDGMPVHEADIQAQILAESRIKEEGYNND